MGKSFRSLARRLFPAGNPRKRRLVALTALLLLAGCGGGGGASKQEVTQGFRGQGYRAQAPQGWEIRRGLRSVTARRSASLVSVTVFPLVKRYRPGLFDQIVPELDRVASQLARREGATVSSRRTEKVAERDARVYELARSGAKERIAFVLAGRREFQLYCKPSTDHACDLLFSSFRIAA